MSEQTDPFEPIAFLARSKTRVQLLASLHEEGPMTQRALRDELEASQSTIVRCAQAMEQYGWIEQFEGALRITATGKFIVEAFTELLEATDEATELSPFLRWFPHDEFSLDLSSFRHATVITASPGDPYAPAREQTELVRTANHLRVFLPSIDMEGTKVVHERVLNGELDAEVVVGPDVGETIRGGEYAQLFRKQLRTGRLAVYCHDEPLPVYLGLDDNARVQIGVEDDGGMPQALLETEHDPVRTWAEDVFRKYRNRATELDAGSFP